MSLRGETNRGGEWKGEKICKHRVKRKNFPKKMGTQIKYIKTGKEQTKERRTDWGQQNKMAQEGRK